MNLYIYSDESGVFDHIHNTYFVFGGIIFLDKEKRDVCSRKYSKAEKDVKAYLHLNKGDEAKASIITNHAKGKLFRALNNQYRFGVIIEEKRVLSRIWQSKKDKQRYLDYVYKIAVKRRLEGLIRQGVLDPSKVKNMYFFVDEHTTATNGRYELRESLETEFKNGIYNPSWDTFHDPLFPNMGSVELHFCNSATKTLVRAADIVANRIYHLANSDSKFVSFEDDLFVIRQP